MDLIHWRSISRVIGLGLMVVSFSATLAKAHEFWLMPENFLVQPGGSLRVDQKNGQHMKGVSIPYLPGEITRFEVVMGEDVAPVVSRLGDIPALDGAAPDQNGLAVVVHETAYSSLRYKEFAKFETFATHKAAPEVLAQHRARGLPDSGFTEIYRRFSKALIAVGTGAGADRAMGLRIEIVAQANPYTDDLTAGLPLLVLLDGQPRPGVQVELFAMAADGSVTETMHTTDAQGVARVPAQSGVTYLADNVVIEALPNNDAKAGPVWKSDWAALTYFVP